MKTISILLTKYSDFTSSLLYHVAGHGYTHASLGLDGMDGRFYSFNFRGFCVETMEKHRKRGIHKSMCYRLQIPDAAYHDIAQRVKNFEMHRGQYQYTRLGVLFAILHIPFYWKNHYSCSRSLTTRCNEEERFCKNAEIQEVIQRKDERYENG